MAWQEITIDVPYEYVEPVSYLFNRYGRSLSMELNGDGLVTLRTYLPDTSRQRLARIDVGIRLVSAIRDLGELRVRPVVDQDWQNAWKAHFDLLKVGQHLVVKPSWIAYEPGPEDVVVELDPGIAFGTGYHPTTYTSLEALERLVKPGARLLDLGTGSGILTIAAIELGASHVIALDIDPQAVRAARQNFRRLGIHRQVSLVEGTLPNPRVQAGQFDLAVANISAKAVRERAPFILSALKQEGLLIAGGMMATQRQEVYDTLSDLGLSQIEVISREDWVTLICGPAGHTGDRQ